MNRLIQGAFAALFLTACAGHIPEPGHPEAVAATEFSPAPGARLAREVPTGNAATDEAREAGLGALQACDAVLLAIPNQQLNLKRVAASRKQGGILVTTIAGVAGSIITAVLANSNSSSSTVTIAGASTAGGTAVAGGISLFIIGAGAEERVELLSQYGRQIEAAETSLKSQCDLVVEAGASACKAQAQRLHSQCTSIQGQLPYIIPAQRT